MSKSWETADAKTLYWIEEEQFGKHDYIKNSDGNILSLTLYGMDLQPLPYFVSELHHIQMITFIDCTFHFFPDIFHMPNLVRLEMTEVCLNKTEIPDRFEKLPRLKFIYFNDCRLGSLPDSIGTLEELEVLQAPRCMLHDIPTSLGNCTSLVHINLRDNYLDDIHFDVDNLDRLESLNMCNNVLSDDTKQYFINAFEPTGVEFYC